MVNRFCSLHRYASVLLSSILLFSGSSAYAANQKANEGAQLFHDKGCTYCHGTDAQGTDKAPSLANIRKKLNAQQVQSQITNGGQKMPRFGDSLSKDEIEELVEFLRARHRPAIPTTDSPSAPAAN